MTRIHKILPSKDERHTLFGSVQPGERTKPSKKEDMPDLQNQKKDFLFPIQAVGIANVRFPVTIHSRIDPITQSSVGSFSLTSSLLQDQKGTNMSRFTEILTAHQGEMPGFDVSLTSITHFLKQLAHRLEQPDAALRIDFPWGFQRKAPVSDYTAFQYVDAFVEASFDREHDETFFRVGMEAKVTTLCPCSKEISEYSAHNQRGRIQVEVSLSEEEAYDFDWKEKLLEAAESNASSILYPVLKRPDEKFVTEKAYENPRFVEDMVRLIASDLYEMEPVRAFSVHCQNEESIHQHDAIAKIVFDKDKDTLA
ncbi:GTP cyclohydrolase I FolE2 [Bacillaceae bacterium SIJ1]|uniref:GTP cyclohydrolase FolE2 n=1 Tax=Litoribacterium kuwaitense TaxID=1398745 RepID=UPI0013EA54E4|nr:GTP cyclohydrolase FolE2 [Litoribacterium kuwaitense]NGP46039.1 GTP cyclohydrolase I FolE2 [Litoribacterium kuwaitense]